jgi:hypothetical protein
MLVNYDLTLHPNAFLKRNLNYNTFIYKRLQLLTIVYKSEVSQKQI